MKWGSQNFEQEFFICKVKYTPVHYNFPKISQLNPCTNSEKKKNIKTQYGKVIPSFQVHQSYLSYAM